MKEPARRVLALASLGAVVVLLALRSNGQTSDALTYMMSAATGREMYHPHHLLYVPIVRLLLLSLHAVGSAADAIFASQLHNTFLAVAAAVLTFFVVRRWGGSTVAAVLAGVALLACRGFWAYSTIADVYVPATACLAGVALLLPRGDEPALGWKTPVVLFLLALAILYHQTNVLMVVPVAFWYAASRARGKLRALSIVLFGAGILVLGAYVLAYLYSDAQAAMAEMGVPPATGFVEGFKRFCLSYTYHPNPQWGTFHNVGPLGIGRVIHSQAWNVLVFSEGTKYAVTGVFALLLFGMLAWHAWQVLRNGPLRRERAFLLLWLATYGAFFLWWLPSEREFFITPLLPLVLAFWMFVRDCAERIPARAGLLTAAAGVFLVGMIAINFAWAILPAHREPGLGYLEAADIARVTPRECLVFESQAAIQSLRYYFGFSRVEEINLPFLHALEGKPIPAKFDFGNASCALIPASYLRPDLRIDVLGGYENPAGFLAFLEWALEVRADPDGAVRYRHYEVVSPRGRGPYLRFDAARKTAGSREELWAQLDADVSSVRNGALSKWWADTHGVSRSRAASP